MKEVEKQLRNLLNENIEQCAKALEDQKEHKNSEVWQNIDFKHNFLNYGWGAIDLSIKMGLDLLTAMQISKAYANKINNL